MRHASWVHQKSSTFEHEFFISADPTRKLNSLTSNKVISSILNQQNKKINTQLDNTNNNSNNPRSYSSLQQLIEFKHPEAASPKAQTIAEVVFQSQENCEVRKRIQGIQEWRNSLNKSKPAAQVVSQVKSNEIIQELIQDQSYNQPQIFTKKINSLQSPVNHIQSITPNVHRMNENGNFLSQRSSKKADNYFHGHFSSQIELNPCSESTRRSLTNVLYPSLSPVKPRQNNQLNFPMSQQVCSQFSQQDVQNSFQNSKLPQQYVKYHPRSQYSLPETTLTSQQQQQQIPQQFLSSQQLQNSFANSPRLLSLQQFPRQRISSQSTDRRISPAKLCNMVNVEMNIEEKSDLNQARLTRAMSKLKRSVRPLYHSEDKKVAGFAPGAAGNRSKNQETNTSGSKGISVQGDHQSLSPRRIVVNKTENFINERKESFLRIKRETCTESNNCDPNYLLNNLESNNIDQLSTLPYTKYLKTSKEWGVFRRTNQNAEQNFQSKFEEYQSTNPTTTTSTTPTVSSGVFQTQGAQQHLKTNKMLKRESKSLTNKGTQYSKDKRRLLLPQELSFVRLSAWDNSFQRKNEDQEGNDDFDLLNDYNQPTLQ